MRKKVLVLLVIGLLLIPLFTFNNTEYSAKTLRDLRSELKTLQNKEAARIARGQRTESEIAYSQNQVKKAQQDIIKGREQIEQANEEIENLNKEIAEKEEQTRELVRFLQIANGENSYLEYVFGATSMTDLINRLAIVEQLSEYNDELITEMNALIKKDKKLKKDLAKKEKELNSNINSLENLIDDLGDELIALGQEGVKLSDDIKKKKEQIKFYENLGCKEDQDLDKCVNMPYDTSFIRPIAIGIISSEYGWRSYAGGQVHYGTDIATGREGYNVYPSAAGKVSTVIKKSSCGGNMVFIDHTVNGVNYSTVYMHLQSIKVKLGDVVYKETVIGKSGGGPSTFGWERCSTGAHLHFGMSRGHYVSYSNWVANSFNSRKKVYFPNGWFYSRT